MDSRQLEGGLTSALAAAAGPSQLLAIRTGVNHLWSVGVRPHHSAVAVRLLRLKGVMHCGTVAAAPGTGGGNR